MATYCISDVHGHYSEFISLLEKIGFCGSDTLYVLGDIIDRGPDSLSMLDFATQTKRDYSNIHYLIGNHEYMMNACLGRNSGTFSVSRTTEWYFNGGKETAHIISKKRGPEWVINELIPWIDSLQFYATPNVEGQKWMLVHAGFDPIMYGTKLIKPSNQVVEVANGFGVQNFHDMLWMRDDWLFSERLAPLPTVHGHTMTIGFEDLLWDLSLVTGSKCSLSKNGILRYKNKIDIDAGASAGYRNGGKLACLRLDDGKEFSVSCRK